MKCMNCSKPATLVNHTQFAGTHYWCAECVPQEDKTDCTELKPCPEEPTTKLNPLYIRSEFKEHFNSGFQLRPHEVTCYLTYTDPKLDTIMVSATAKTHHKAKQLAYKNLHAQVALEQDQYQVADLSTQPPNPYTNDRVQYLLDKLQEEAAEVIQAVSKIRRFGPHNHHPDRDQTNLQELTGELEDFQAIVIALEATKYLDPKPQTGNIIRKYNTLMGS